MSKQQAVAVVDAPRVLPHNLEAERAVLGAVLIEPIMLHVAMSILPGPEPFFRDAHRRIYAALLELDRTDKPIELVTLKEQLDQKRELDEVGGPAYIGSLVDGVPRSTNVLAYAEIVKEKATLRNLIFAANAITSTAYEASEPAEQVMRRAEQKLFDLVNGHTPSQMRDLRGGLKTLAAELEYREKNRGKVTGVPTGFDSVDKITLGWQPGDLTFIGARPSIGKTTFVVNSVVEGAARAGVKSAIFSMEMSRHQLEFRMLSGISEVPLTRMLKGEFAHGDYGKIANAMEVMSDLPIYIDDTPARSIWDIRSTCRRMQAEIGLGLVVVDYVQLMRGTIDRRGATRNDELTDISNRFKSLAKELRVPIIVLSQLARRSVDRPDPRPKISDLKDCGAFEQDADNIGLLHRKRHEEGGPTELIMAKQRNGPTGTKVLTLDRDIVKFTDGGEMPAEPKPPAKPVKAGRGQRAPRLPESD